MTKRITFYIDTHEITLPEGSYQIHGKTIQNYLVKHEEKPKKTAALRFNNTRTKRCRSGGCNKKEKRWKNGTNAKSQS